jgi:murein L,D-transpeptidase YafK
MLLKTTAPSVLSFLVGVAGRCSVAALILTSSLARADSAMLSSPTRAEDPWRADLVIVEKSARRLHLMRGAQRLRSYEISLGSEPEGHKLREGDNRTPEGDYVLDWRNEDSAYFMSIHISYPNQRDLRLARERGVDPGDMIMIHGLPNDSLPTLSDYIGEDWTNGCIAVSNQAMIDIWLSVSDATPIRILP